jgi:hypothetical protein
VDRRSNNGTYTVSTTHAITRSERRTTEIIENGRIEALSTRSRYVRPAAGSLQTVATLEKWRDAVKEVRQVPITSVEMLPETYLKGQTPREVARATPATELTFDSLPQISFDPLQEWEGRVVEVKDDRFFANLLDITAGKHFEEEIAEFPLDDVSDIDRPLLRPGAIFRWLIGYARRSSGTKYRVSSIVFRRLPQWTSIDIVRAETEATRILSSVKWE